MPESKRPDIATVARYTVILEIMPPFRALQDRPGQQAGGPCSVNTALLASRTMLSWEKIDAISGLVRLPLLRPVAQPARLPERRNCAATCSRSACGAAARPRCWPPTAAATRRSISATSGRRRGVRTAFAGVGRGRKLVAISAPVERAAGRLDLSAMHRACAGCTSTASTPARPSTRARARQPASCGPTGLVVIDDFFSPRYPANTTEALRYMEKESLPLPPARRRLSTRPICAAPRRWPGTWISSPAG
jgi:hypothetical protein